MPRRKTQEEFEQEVLEKIGPDYKVLGKYINKDTKIEVIHYVCGNKFLKRPHDITSKKSGCPYCNGNHIARYNEQWVKENTPLPYHYIKGYQNMSSKCTFYCDNCKNYFEQLPKRLINQKIYGCKCTYRTKKKTHQDFLEELGAETLKEYEILEEYINIDTKIKFKHINCGTIFSISPYAFIHKANKKYCPICYYKKSKGEIEISKFLDQNNFAYQREFSFAGSKNRYDFYLPELKTCIEYDGKQHFEANNFFGGEKEFQKLKERDYEKNFFCLKNGITLYRIPYTDFDNIPKILYKIFKEKSSTTIEKYLVTKQSTL